MTETSRYLVGFTEDRSCLSYRKTSAVLTEHIGDQHKIIFHWCKW